MKVKIVKCSIGSSWYCNGETYDVVDDDNHFFRFSPNKTILKSDCEVIDTDEYDTDNVEEHGCIERVLPDEQKESPTQPNFDNLVADSIERKDSIYNLAKEEVKSCETCNSYGNYGSDSCDKYTGYCNNFDKWTLKEVTNEKPNSKCLYCRNLAETSEKEPCNACFKGDKFEPQKPKVKKYKYVCRECIDVKCKFITPSGVHDTLNHCPIGGDAKWKLKKEKTNDKQ
jgi:hypothetical protein